MKILLVHRYIRPDTPGYAHMLYLMGKRMAEEGHEVTIFSAQPSYNDAYNGPALPRVETVDGMKIIRTGLFKETKKSVFWRSVNFALFAIKLILHAVVRVKPYDLMTVSTFPPTLMGAVARSIRFFRFTPYIYHCMDLYPEIAMASGIIKKKWLMNFAAWIDRQNCEKAAQIVVLSDDMADTIRDRGVANPNLTVLNNFIIDEVDHEFQLPTELQPHEGRFRVLFAGNLGRFQSLETIVEAAERLSYRENIEFLFVGSGVMVDELKKQAGDLLGVTVHFHPYMPIEEVMSLIATSHLGVVSLTPGVIEAAYPSKTMSYLEAGCKLLAIVEPDSELAMFVENHNLGVVCSERNGQAVADAVEDAFDSWRSGNYDREKVRQIGREHFSQEVILDRWLDLIDQIPTNKAT